MLTKHLIKNILFHSDCVYLAKTKDTLIIVENTDETFNI